MYHLLRYSDEIDKSLGVAGMAIALLACEGTHCVAAVSVVDGEDTLEFSPEAFFVNNPRFSPKIAWNHLLKELHIFSGLLFGNVLCRHIVVSKKVKQEIIDILHSLIAEQGVEKCSLEQDEIEDLFQKDLNYFHRLFSHPTVGDVAKDFANNLRIQRRMSAGEVFENLRRLSYI